MEEIFLSSIIKISCKLELNRIEFSLEKLRQHDSSAYLRMANSIEHHSQLVPIIAIPDGNQQWKLIDGYLRTRALQKLGFDTCNAEVWECDTATGLLFLLAKGRERHLEAIEQANILEVLHYEIGLSQHEIANKIARDVSWVNRRLALLKDLPSIVRETYYQGHLSTWAIARVIQPLARANEGHANQLAAHLNKNPQSTRAIQHFFEHYVRSNQEIRERIINNPLLFFESIENKHKAEEAKTLKLGPEGRWQKNMEIIKNMLKGLKKLIETVFYSNQDDHCQKQLRKSFQETRQTFLELNDLFEKHIYAITTTSSNNIRNARGKSFNKRHQPQA
jgi:ParB/RepB/Spo0J family partition protein